jgi:hypothetical protein
MGVSAGAQTEDTSVAISDTICYSRIKGMVIDDNTKESIPGAMVIIQNTQDTLVTDMNGAFETKIIIPGHYKVKAHLLGYHEIISDEIIIKLKTTVHMVINLKQKPITMDDNWGCPPSMVTPDQTGTVRIWTESEIRKLPGH